MMLGILGVGKNGAILREPRFAMLFDENKAIVENAWKFVVNFISLCQQSFASTAGRVTGKLQ